MDIVTVNNIISMIDARVKNLEFELSTEPSIECAAQIEVLKSLSTHLDNCVESQLNAMENSMGN